MLVREYETCESVAALAERMGRTRQAVHLKAQKLELQWRGPDRGRAPTVNRPIEDLMADLAGDYERKRAHHQAKKDGLEIELQETLPFGIVFVGDPHLGDPGCDIEHLAHVLDIVKRTEGLYAVNMGDLSNNWVGSLGRLYAHQHTTDDEEIELASWLIGQHDWLCTILGNHDKWSKVAELLCKQHGVRYVSHGAKLLVKTPTGVVKIDARHTHRGNSMYNPSHGQLKQSYRGTDCDIVVGAHTHTSAHTVLRNGVTGKVTHAVRVGAFKKWDDYADAGGFDADSIGPLWMALCDPGADDLARITGFWDLDTGVEVLGLLRDSRG